MKHLLVLIIAGFLASPFPAHSRVDLLRVITANQMRSHMFIVMDTSGSMNGKMVDVPCTSATVSGADCSGNRTNTVDYCGDGWCSGQETSTSCAADCINIPFNNTHHIPGWAAPGSVGLCRSEMLLSRTSMTKRVLRYLLPQLRTAGNFGLIPLKQTGYFVYDRVPIFLPVGSTKPVTVFFSEWELKTFGGWDTLNDRPNNDPNGWNWAGNFDLPPYTRLKLLTVGPYGSFDTPATNNDSLYRRADDSSVEKRFPWNGKVLIEGDVTWEYVGSLYTYDQLPVEKSFSPDVAGWEMPAVTTTETTYRGPQFFDGSDLWVYRRYNPPPCYNTGLGYPANESHELINGYYHDGYRVVENISGDESQQAIDNQIGRILSALNTVQNGGLLSIGDTALGSAILGAKEQIVAFPSATEDTSACRPRFILVITDGRTFHGTPPDEAAEAVYEAYPDNPIKTFVVGLPGTDKDRVDPIAEAGGTNEAYFANNEEELVTALKDVFFEAFSGDYSSSNSGASAAGANSAFESIALVPSTEFPSWKGHLRAYDLTQLRTSPSYQLWDAGEELTSRDWKTRKLYTGYPDSNNRGPVMLINGDGDVNLDGTGFTDSVGVKGVWPGAPPTDDDEITAFVQNLAGKDRDWKLDAIFNSVPATVGPPPVYPEVPNHGGFETAYTNRDTLVYISSNSGFTHAFCVRSDNFPRTCEPGQEMFAYISPHVLQKVFDLFKAGGQDQDPANYVWIQANSPRVDDIPISSAGSSYRTHMVLTQGPGGEHFWVLDVTDPSLDPPFLILNHSQRDSTTGLFEVLGETWSIPALFYKMQGGDVDGRASMGSGYGHAGAEEEGLYYNFFSDLDNNGAWNFASSKRASYELEADLPLAVQPHAVLASVVGAITETTERIIVSTYQADLMGHITRFEEALISPANNVDRIFPLETEDTWDGHPFHFAPAAALNEQLGSVTVAFASGSYYETPSDVINPFTSTMFLRTELEGNVNSSTLDLHFSCPVDRICTAESGCFEGDSEIPSCTSPAATAVPVDRPLIIRNTRYANRTEAFYLYQEPPTTKCIGNTIAVGNSYLIRVAFSPTGAPRKLVTMKKYEETLSTGLTLIGAGSDVMVSQVGRHGTPPKIELLKGTVLPPGSMGGEAIVEGWREAR
ncbi:MAG: hypothetical protein V1754_06895 [Pseudomonadota bacterium]